MSESIRVFVCDDYPLIRAGVRAMLASYGDIEVVGEASSAEGSLLPIAELLPDVVLMDVVLPGMDGINATREIKATCPSVAIIGLTRYDDSDHILKLYQSGASAYLIKSVEAEHLVETIRLVARGGVILHPGIAERVVLAIGGAPASVPVPVKVERHGLTEREIGVLRLVAEGLSNKQIGEGLGISARTVENHLSNILRKLNVNFRLQAALYAIREGLTGDTPGEGEAGAAASNIRYIGAEGP